MRDEDAFIKGVLACPRDPAPRLVYADWLEDRGDPRAEYVRLQWRLDQLRAADPLARYLFARLRELEAGFRPRWIRLMQRGRQQHPLARKRTGRRSPRRAGRLHGA